MPFIIVHDNKASIANGAMVFPFICMDFHVTHQMAALRKVFQANATLIRFQSFVHPHVSRPTDHVRKAFMANITTVRFRIVMGEQMFFIIVIVTVGARTFLTLKRFLITMQYLMAAKRFLMHKVFIANITMERLVFRMQTNVLIVQRFFR